MEIEFNFNEIEFNSYTEEQKEYLRKRSIHRNKVFLWLQKLPCGSKTEISKVSKPETREQFIATLKEAIDLRFLVHQGYYFEFNEDYTMFAKKTL